MEQEQLRELCGCVEEVTFRNEDSGFTVLDMNSDGELVTAVGVLPDVAAGEELRLMGEWTYHNVFGRQFKAELCERYLPANAAAMLKYLSSGAVKGIGSSTAEKIVSEYGDETFEVLEKHPEKLAKIKGISLDKAKKMSEEFKNQFAVRQVMIYLEGFGMSPSECLRAYKAFGNKTVDLINSNPYILCSDGIVGFERADSIAQAMPKKPDNIYRVRAGIIYVVTHNLYNGHTCVPREKLLVPTGDLLGSSVQEIQDAIDDLINNRKLVEYTMNGREYLFLPKIYFAESSAAKRIKLLSKYPPPGKPALDRDIDKIEKKLKIEYAEMQRLAITTAIQKGMLILTGGPGTGKTTILNGILELYEQDGLKIALAAPTGRAAKRMSEVTGREAKTLHRLLEVEWDKDENQTFKRHAGNPIDADALIIDELSMVDIQLFAAMLDALPLGCRLVMVGDCDQLPAVGAGNVLHDMIDSGLLPVVELKEVFRQAMQSQIVTNAHRIVDGEMPDLKSTDSDFFYMERLNQQKAVATVTELCTQRLPKAYSYSPIADIQVICPSRKGELGTKNLNYALQQTLNPAEKGKKEILSNGQTLRVGDKVMQIKNNYDIPWSKAKDDGLGVFNGDVGILTDINVSAASLTVTFDDKKTAYYSIEGAKELELAYAVTVHKSQGSEFEAVVMPILNVVPQLSYRNLLYTAVTRAKNIMIIVGDKNQVAAMVNNDRKTKRFSALKEFLIADGHKESDL